jgi:endo-1,3(4)-beta-glucanase
LAYPYNYRALGGPSSNNKNGEVGGAIEYYLHGQSTDMVLSAAELNFANFQVDSWDELGVRVSFSTLDGKQRMSSSLISGMAFVTAEYESMKPVLASQYGITRVNEEAFSITKIYSLDSNSKLVLEFDNGQTWAVYSTCDTTMDFQWDESRSELMALESCNGAIRVTLVTDAHVTDIGHYDLYSSCIPTGAKLIADDSFGYGWNWETTGDCSNGLLHYAFHHQHKTMDLSHVKHLEDLTRHSTTRGPMYAYATVMKDEMKSPSPQWRMIEQEDVSIGFYPSEPITKNLVQKYNIQKQLHDDIHAEWHIAQGGSYYFTGKKLQMYASLCLMASDANVVDGDDLLELCKQKLRIAMEYFLINSWSHPIVYDEVYGGLISSQAFDTNDMWCDFGNTMYNDHHYHFGYLVVAGAIQRFLDPTWERIPELVKNIEYLIRDVANANGEEDVYFPSFRHFSWFHGHSFSHGITPFADGKDQESTSEDMNFDYGMMLWGKVSGNAKLEALAKLMLKVNSRAIQTYFLMSDDNPIHPPAFVKNKVTGIFFDNKAHYATWFSPARHCIHGIQMLPVSPITDMFRSQTFVAQEWEQVLSKVSIVTDVSASDPWQSLLFTNYATIDKIGALEKLVTVPMDDGLTRSWALYMAATKPDYNP